MEPLLYATIDSPVGELLLLGDGGALRGLYMQEGRTRLEVRPEWIRDDEPFGGVREQLDEYFGGRRAAFDVPIELDGTPFQRRVWRALQEIPYGETVTYGQLARRIGRPAASRAVGAANGQNPVSVVVPCHRVVGADGTLTGYGGGLKRKRFLLDLEADRRPPVSKTYTLLGADRRSYQSARPGVLGGHRRSKGYGRLDCPAALRWIAKGYYVSHRVFFADEETAIAAGFRPCAVCLPERYREWKEARGATARRR